jgi:hypothetical protein
MKPLIPILVVATTSLAVASVQFAQQASSQRKRADAELQLRLKQDARVAELERNQARLERDLALARQQGSTAAPPVAMTSQRPAGTRPPPAFGLIAGAGDSGGTPPSPPFEVRPGRGPLDSPAGRNFMRSRMKNQIRRLYGDVGEALGLSAEKSNQLLNLIADQQTRDIVFGRPGIPDGKTPQQNFQEQQQKNQDEIKALIGADKVDEWAAYQKSLPQRAELGQVRDQLEQSGYPMTDSQRTEMLAAITEESQRLPRPTFSQGIPPEESMAQMNQWQNEYSKALLDRAKSVLTADQYNTYKEYQDWQTEMRANLPRMGNGGGAGVVMRGVQSVGGPVAGPVVNFAVAAPMPAAPSPPPQPAQNQRK